MISIVLIYLATVYNSVYAIICQGEIQLDRHLFLSWLDKFGNRYKKEATMGIEPMMRVLQTPALPLGHVA